MNNSSKKKNDLLGMPVGTASAKLRKTILFQLLQETGKDICFRCKEKIETIDTLSIEHKISWQFSINPIETFFNLNNITFSHLKCNISFANRSIGHPNWRGENNPKSKLTNETVINIKKDLQSGMRQMDVSKKYRVSRDTIYQIKSGKCWRYTE